MQSPLSDILRCPNCDGVLTAEEVLSAPLRCPHCNELLLPKFPRWYKRLRFVTCFVAGFAIPLWRHPDWGSFVIFVVGFYWWVAILTWEGIARSFLRPFLWPKQLELAWRRPLVQTLDIGPPHRTN